MLMSAQRCLISAEPYPVTKAVQHSPGATIAKCGVKARLVDDERRARRRDVKQENERCKVAAKSLPFPRLHHQGHTESQR